jgi:hypothetical protein
MRNSMTMSSHGMWCSLATIDDTAASPWSPHTSFETSSGQPRHEFLIVGPAKKERSENICGQVLAWHAMYIYYYSMLCFDAWSEGCPSRDCSCNLVKSNIQFQIERIQVNMQVFLAESCVILGTIHQARHNSATNRIYRIKGFPAAPASESRGCELTGPTASPGRGPSTPNRSEMHVNNMYLETHVRVHVRVRMCVCVWVGVRAHRVWVYMRAHALAHVHAHARARAHACVRDCTYACEYL